MLVLSNLQRRLSQRRWLKLDSPVYILVLGCILCSITGCGHVASYQQSVNKQGVRVGLVEPTAADVASQVVQAIDHHDVPALYRLSDPHMPQRNVTICALLQRWPKQMLQWPESGSGVGPYTNMDYHEEHYLGKNVHIPIRMKHQHDAFYAMLKLRYTERGWRVAALEELVPSTGRTMDFQALSSAPSQTCPLPQSQKPA